MKARLQGGPSNGRTVDLATPLPGTVAIIRCNAPALQLDDDGPDPTAPAHDVDHYSLQWRVVGPDRYEAVYTHERR